MGKQAINAPRGESTFKCDPNNLTIVGLDTDDGPEHELWVEDVKAPVDMAMVHDILDQGILEPVIVRVNGTTTEVVAGRGRTKAARKANEILETKYDKEDVAEEKRVYVKVPCIRRAGDIKAMVKAVISENANRKVLSLLESANAVSRAIQVGGLTEKEAAVAFGVDQQTIRNRLQLLQASKAVLKAVRSGTLSATGAMKLAVLSHEEQDAALDEMLTSGDTGSEAAARTARGKKAKAKGANGVTTEYEPPGKRVLRKIVESENAAEAIDANAIKAIKWVLGLTPASQIKGLAALVAAIETGDA